MIRKNISPSAIPEWFLETVQVMQDTDRGLRSIETELRHALELEGMDPRLRDEVQYLRDALGAVKISLSVMDMIAEKVLRDMSVRKTSGPGRDAA